jgi:hypothetical protein
MIMFLYSGNITTPSNTLCRRKAQLLNFKADGPRCSDSALKIPSVHENSVRSLPTRTVRIITQVGVAVTVSILAVQVEGVGGF